MAALDYFLKIDGVEGESLDSKHKGEIELDSWAWGETQAALPSGGGRGGAGKVEMQDFQFATPVTKASPRLFQACASGQRFKSAQLTARKAGEQQLEFLRYTLSDDPGGLHRATARRLGRRDGLGKLGRQDEQEGLRPEA